MGSASLVAISTLTSEINFYTRLIKVRAARLCVQSPVCVCDGTYGPQMTDPATDRALFATRCIELCCEDCTEKGATASCNHLLHLVPSWQSEERHCKLKVKCFYLLLMY